MFGNRRGRSIMKRCRESTVAMGEAVHLTLVAEAMKKTRRLLNPISLEKWPGRGGFSDALNHSTLPKSNSKSN